MSTGDNKAVFLSYASQDTEAVLRIAEALRAAGVEVWFDQNELVGGDAWDAKIRGQIASCALFVPVISAATQARHEGYFRLEWKLAAHRTHMMSGAKAFLLPVVIDGTRDADAHVPAEFRAVQWTRLAGGEGAAVDKFCARVAKLLGGSDVAPAFQPVSADADTGWKGRATSKVGRRVPVAVWGGALFAVAAFVSVFLLRPEPENRAEVRASAPGKAAPAASPSAAEEKILVVLPLENLSPDPADAFFTDGMHSEIISRLQQLAGVRVISRASSLQFKSTAPLREVAAKLGEGHAITGSVRRGNGQVRIQLELRRTRDDALLWTQSYNRELHDVLSVQGEIAADVARVLQARDSKGWSGSAQVMTNNPRALDLFLKANQAFMDRSISADHSSLVAMMEEAVRLDPNFMWAASLLSTLHNVQFRTKRDSRERAHHAAEAKRWAETASRLVPGGAGDSALAAYYFRIAGDPERGLALLDNVVRALPNDPEPLNRRALVLGLLGRYSEAAGVFAEAVKLDPLNPLTRGNQLITLARLRRAQEVERAAAELEALIAQPGRASTGLIQARLLLQGELPVSMNDMPTEDKRYWLGAAGRSAELLALAEGELAKPGLSGADEFTWRVTTAQALLRLKRPAEATAAARRSLVLAETLKSEADIEPAERDRRLALALVLTGRHEEGFAAQRRAIQVFAPPRLAERWSEEIQLARLYAQAGRAEECVQTLRPLLRVPCFLSVPMLRSDAAWDAVREDGRFKALLADPTNSAPL